MLTWEEYLLFFKIRKRGLVKVEEYALAIKNACLTLSHTGRKICRYEGDLNFYRRDCGYKIVSEGGGDFATNICEEKPEWDFDAKDMCLKTKVGDFEIRLFSGENPTLFLDKNSNEDE